MDLVHLEGVFDVLDMYLWLRCCGWGVVVVWLWWLCVVVVLCDCGVIVVYGCCVVMCGCCVVVCVFFVAFVWLWCGCCVIVSSCGFETLRS